MDDGRPDNYGRQWSRDLSQRSLARVAVHETQDALRAEGHRVSDCWSPEWEPNRHPERRRRPDGWCLVDGIPTAIDHTMFLTKRRGRQWARLAQDRPRDVLALIAISGRRAPEEFDAFVDWAVAKKGDQHDEWGRGILAVMHNWDQPHHLLREAIERRGAVPWWRVYWIDRSPPAILVWESS